MPESLLFCTIQKLCSVFDPKLFLAWQEENMKPTNSDLRKYPTIGVCGLDCGLCRDIILQGPRNVLDVVAPISLINIRHVLS